MKFAAACLSALVVLSAPSLACAGPVVDAAERAESLQAEGKTIEALEALDAAIEAIWSASPLQFRKVLVVDSSEGYGIYQERADTTYRPDDRMVIYVEPVGFGYGTPGAEDTIAFKADLAIENMSGQVLGESKDLFSLATPGMPGKREFSLTLAFGVPYLRPGEYKAVLTVRDQNSSKSGTFEVPFSVALPSAAGAAQPQP